MAGHEAPAPSIFSAFPAENDEHLIMRWGKHFRSIPYEFSAAARRLASTLTGDPTDDALLHPLLYLYRHAIEMAMKQSILDAAELRRFRGESDPDLDEAALTKRLNTKIRHNLTLLLDEYDAQLAAARLQALPEGTRRGIQLIVNADPVGNSFRFPVEFFGSEHINFVALSNFLDETFHTVDATVDVIAAARDIEQDYQETLRDAVDYPGW